MGGKGRTLVADLFRGLTVPRTPNLWQSLPAEKQYEFENSEEYVSLGKELAALGGRTDKKSIGRREELYREKRKLFNNELRDWQKHQPNKHNDAPGYHRAIFDRVRFMMPERDRLASNLFQVAALRSDTGVAVLRDMMALYQSRSEVEYRPGLEPDKCCCWNDNP